MELEADVLSNLDTIDFSGAGMYLRCGEQFRRRYILGQVDPPGIARVEGSAYHETLAEANRHKRDTGAQIKLQRLVDRLAHEIDLNTDPKRVGDLEWGEETKDNIIKRAKILLPEYHRKFDPKIDPDWVEQPVIKEVEVNGTKFKIAGVLDLTTKKGKSQISGAVVDYKTSSSAKSQNEVNESLQLSIYSYATKLRRVGYVNFVKTKTPYVQFIMGERTPADVAWASQVLERVYKSIKAGIFPLADPDPRNWWCSAKFCGFWSDCRGKFVKMREQRLK